MGLGWRVALLAELLRASVNIISTVRKQPDNQYSAYISILEREAFHKLLWTAIEMLHKLQFRVIAIGYSLPVATKRTEHLNLKLELEFVVVIVKVVILIISHDNIVNCSDLASLRSRILSSLIFLRALFTVIHSLHIIIIIKKLENCVRCVRVLCRELSLYLSKKVLVQSQI